MGSYFRYCNYPGDPSRGVAALSTSERGPLNSAGDQALPRVPRPLRVDDLVLSAPGVDPSSLCRCTVCERIFCDPVICRNCEDSFCDNCLKPHCRESDECGGQLFETVVRNGHLRKVVLGLRQRCRYAMVFNHATDKWELDGLGCPYIGKGSDVQAHQETCGYRFASCPRCQSIFTERDRSSHTATCRIRCQLCKELIYFKNFVPHLQESCPEASWECPSNRCTFLGSRRDLPEHAQRCPLLLPSQRPPPNGGPAVKSGEMVRKMIKVVKKRLPGEGSTGLDAPLQTSKTQPAGDMQTPERKSVSVARDPRSLYGITPEEPGTPPSEINTPTFPEVAMATPSGPSTGHRSEGNIARDGRPGEGGVASGNRSETESEEAEGEDSQGTSENSGDCGEDIHTGQSSAEEPSARAEAGLHDLLYRPHFWVTLDQSLRGKNGKHLLHALEGLIKQRGPEELRGALLETESQLDKAALVPLHGGTLRLLFLILTGKSDVRAHKLTMEFLSGEISDALGMTDVSSGGGTERWRDSKEERPKKLLKNVCGASSSARVPPGFTYSSRQRQLERNRIIKRILERLEKAECAQDFREPVTDKVAPGYSKVISRPMCLSTIFTKIADSDYTVATLRDDMELIRQNAHTFCKDSFPAIVARADQLIELFTAELEMERGELAQWDG